ncbi:unnamed protein product [Clavelina lepadiformis]|uniref:Uncharacterized protein n=1 Tax=Clavelina lepadiformis TaxID=159417 RepID=A0ABP0FHC0_CLALP
MMKLGYFVLVFILFSAVCVETASTEEKNNETKCLRSNEHSTCACPFQTKPLNTFSFWNAEKDIREFAQTCEPLNLPFNESTCKIYPINDEEKTEYEYLCPNNGFLQTWGAFAPRTGSYSIRLWWVLFSVISRAYGLYDA